MKNFSTWMLVMFMILFWILRIIVAVSAELNWDLGALKPLNQQVEIILLFVVLVSRRQCRAGFRGFGRGKGRRFRPGGLG